MTQTLIHASTPFATTIAAALLMLRIATIKGQSSRSTAPAGAQRVNDA